MKTAGLQRLWSGVFASDLVAFFKLIKDVAPAIAAARSANFPKIGHGHSLEIGSRCAPLGTVKDRLATNQFLKHVSQD
jgi:hypothetical protein